MIRMIALSVCALGLTGCGLPQGPTIPTVDAIIADTLGIVPAARSAPPAKARVGDAGTMAAGDEAAAAEASGEDEAGEGEGEWAEGEGHEGESGAAEAGEGAALAGAAEAE